MTSKFLILLAVLATLVAIRCGMEAWLQPALSGFSVRPQAAFIVDGLISVVNWLHQMLGVGAVGVVVLMARSVADVVAERGARSQARSRRVLS